MSAIQSFHYIEKRLDNISSDGDKAKIAKNRRYSIKENNKKNCLKLFNKTSKKLINHKESIKAIQTKTENPERKL